MLSRAFQEQRHLRGPPWGGGLEAAGAGHRRPAGPPWDLALSRFSCHTVLPSLARSLASRTAPPPTHFPSSALLGQTALSRCVSRPSFCSARLRLGQGVLLPFSDLLSCPRGGKTRTFFLLPESHYLLGEPQPIYVSRERHSMPPSPKARPWLRLRPSAGRRAGLWPRHLSAPFLAGRDHALSCPVSGWTCPRSFMRSATSIPWLGMGFVSYYLC